MKLPSLTLAATIMAASKQVAAQQTPPDFGDLVRLLRDDFGVPKYAHGDFPEDCNTLSTTGCCKWPLAFNTGDPDLCPSDCVTTEDGVPVINPDVINQVTCTFEETVSCGGCLHEVDFGRTSVQRSPEAVLTDQYNEVISNLQLSLCDPVIDPTGRLVYYVEGTDVDIKPSTIDSPLQNLAMYRELVMLYPNPGNLGDTPLPQGAGELITAARALGAAFDKSGEITIDFIAESNRILGVVDDEDICIWIREEYMSEGTVPRKYCFFNYFDFEYDRAGNFNNLPQPPYIDTDGDGIADPGAIEYLKPFDVPESCNPDGLTLYTIERGLTTEAIDPAIPAIEFTDSLFTSGNNMNAFLHAADDTRAVINFLHTWPLPEVDATTQEGTNCHPEVPRPDSFNVYIKELQTPKNINMGQEFREFAVFAEISTSVSTARHICFHVEAVVVDSDGNALNRLEEWSSEFSLGPTSTAHEYRAEIPGSLTYVVGAKKIVWAVTIECHPEHGPGDGDEHCNFSSGVEGATDWDVSDNSKTDTTRIKSTGGPNLRRGL